MAAVVGCLLASVTGCGLGGEKSLAEVEAAFAEVTPPTQAVFIRVVDSSPTESLGERPYQFLEYQMAAGNAEEARAQWDAALQAGGYKNVWTDGDSSSWDDGELRIVIRCGDNDSGERFCTVDARGSV